MCWLSFSQNSEFPYPLMEDVFTLGWIGVQWTEEESLVYALVTDASMPVIRKVPAADRAWSF